MSAESAGPGALNTQPPCGSSRFRARPKERTREHSNGFLPGKAKGAQNLIHARMVPHPHMRHGLTGRHRHLPALPAGCSVGPLLRQPRAACDFRPYLWPRTHEQFVLGSLYQFQRILTSARAACAFAIALGGYWRGEASPGPLRCTSSPQSVVSNISAVLLD
ncbi:hypothetical protein BOTBODRAFT_202163 [Botryobasidium botryosum FD-172 SS1]|uniref:Uncharacterized protein n=1 Tax=Botryobasidium botryosum (strain FD-172 SS1) TaxID=930990 RepID=A0A067N0P2_BOTB1|nr:hypothetical protein BOTBODRAFT_202163 [Botryobasidium botryosum FD-172 SS1]